jgi:hypothetical protein
MKVKDMHFAEGIKDHSCARGFYLDKSEIFAGSLNTRVYWTVCSVPARYGRVAKPSARSPPPERPTLREGPEEKSSEERPRVDNHTPLERGVVGLSRQVFSLENRFVRPCRLSEVTKRVMSETRDASLPRFGPLLRVNLLLLLDY